MNGADPCASAVSTDDVRVRHAEGGAGLSSSSELAAIVIEGRYVRALVDYAHGKCRNGIDVN